MAKSPAEIGSLAREQCPSAIHVLKGIMNNKKSAESARIQASNSLLDRGLGKPAQAVNVAVQVQVTEIKHIIVRPGDVIEGECEVIEPAPPALPDPDA